MRHLHRGALPLMLLACACGAQAEVTFSNVFIGGTLVDGATYETGLTDIDFVLPDAFVGDIAAPRRFGNIIITFEAQSDVPLELDLLAIEGALEGSGVIYFNEVVEDLATPGILATHNALLDEASELPYTADIWFDRASTHIKVKKTLVLSALDTPASDLAAVALIEQRVIPEPATALLLGLMALAAVRRR
jgi:hypothetical protein